MRSSFGRQCASTFAAEGGGSWPSIASRATRPSISGGGAWPESPGRSSCIAATRASRAASRLIATPAIACAPSTSHRVCSSVLNTCRAWALRGTCRAWSAASWWRSFSAAESAWPRARTTCWYGRDGSGRSIRTVLPAAPGFSVTNSTSSSPVRPIARAAAAVARRSPSRVSLVRLAPCFSSTGIVASCGHWSCRSTVSSRCHAASSGARSSSVPSRAFRSGSRSRPSPAARRRSSAGSTRRRSSARPRRTC